MRFNHEYNWFRVFVCTAIIVAGSSIGMPDALYCGLIALAVGLPIMMIIEYLLARI